MKIDSEAYALVPERRSRWVSVERRRREQLMPEAVRELFRFGGREYEAKGKAFWIHDFVS